MFLSYRFVCVFWNSLFLGCSLTAVCCCSNTHNVKTNKCQMWRDGCLSLYFSRCFTVQVWSFHGYGKLFPDFMHFRRRTFMGSYMLFYLSLKWSLEYITKYREIGSFCFEQIILPYLYITEFNLDNLHFSLVFPYLEKYVFCVFNCLISFQLTKALLLNN